MKIKACFSLTKFPVVEPCSFMKKASEDEIREVIIVTIDSTNPYMISEGL